MHVSILALQPILKASALPPLEVDAAINPLDALLDSTLCSWRGVIREELLHIVAPAVLPRPVDFRHFGHCLPFGSRALI